MNMYKRQYSRRTKKILKSLAATRKVLWALAETAATIGGALLVPGQSRNALVFGGLDGLALLRDQMEENEIRRAFHDLRRREFVAIRRRASRFEIVLTEKGMVAAAIESVRLSGPCESGTVSLVTFDFPEKARAQRNKFRWLLSDLGLKMLHRSVWITDRDIGPALTHILEKMGLGEWVRVFKARRLFGPPLH